MKTIILLFSMLLAPWVSSQDIADAPAGKSMAVYADFNADGHRDFYATNPEGKDRMFLFRDGKNQDFTDRVHLGGQTDTVFAHVVDLDGNDFPDLALIKEDGTLKVMLNKRGIFSDVSSDPAHDATAKAASVVTVTGTTTVGGLVIAQATRICPVSMDDQASTACIKASSTPTLGLLYPQTVNLNVAGTGASVSQAAVTFYGQFTSQRTGSSIAGLGDINGDGVADWIYGSNGPNASGFNNGEAVVVSGRDGSAIYTYTGAVNHAALGSAVADAGDVNNDGTSDFVIGKPQSQTPGFAEVYSGVDGSLLYSFSGNGTGDSFGVAVAGAGDVNGDGYDDVIAGPHVYLLSIQGPSYARVFSGFDGSLLYHLTGSSTEVDFFGNAVSGLDDVNGDGKDDFIVGAPGNNSFTGQATVFSGLNGAAIHTLNGFESDSSFGRAVNNAGDIDGDGTADLIVGSPNENGGIGTYAGAARVFSGATGALIYTFTGNAASDRFGSAVAGDQDLDGDGVPELIIGAPQDFPTGTGAGYVAVYSGATGSLMYTFNGEEIDEYFGREVDLMPGAALVGAPYYSAQINTGGRAMAYALSAVGMGTSNPSDRLQVTGIIHSTVGGLKFPDGTIQADLNRGADGPQGPTGPKGPDGPQGPNASGVRLLNGSNGPNISIVGTGAMSVTSSGSNITLKVGANTCTWGSKTYTPGARCYTNPTNCPTGIGWRATRQTCKTDGTWQTSTSSLCYNPSPTPICGF
ncbi:MAG: hypothetical protein QNK37_19185 [Acidobacteriota bacterium]|nr:hypothetical protein [Acidobacteriota bacterium]